MKTLKSILAFLFVASIPHIAVLTTKLYCPDWEIKDPVGFAIAVVFFMIFAGVTFEVVYTHDDQ